MKRRNLIKTVLGSAAALSLPSKGMNPPKDLNLPTPAAAINGIPSRFAFGGQFNFGEVTFYQHLPKSGMTSFFEAIREDLTASNICTMNFRANLCSAHTAISHMRAFIKQEGKALMLKDGINSYEEIIKLKELAANHPNLSIICATTSRDHKMEWFADNVINFSSYKDGLASHKCELITNRRKFSGPRVKYFSEATDGQFHNVGVTEQI